MMKYANRLLLIDDDADMVRLLSKVIGRSFADQIELVDPEKLVTLLEQACDRVLRWKQAFRGTLHLEFQAQTAT